MWITESRRANQNGRSPQRQPMNGDVNEGTEEGGIYPQPFPDYGRIKINQYLLSLLDLSEIFPVQKDTVEVEEVLFLARHPDKSAWSATASGTVDAANLGPQFAIDNVLQPARNGIYEGDQDQYFSWLQVRNTVHIPIFSLFVKKVALQIPPKENGPLLIYFTLMLRFLYL